MISDLTEEERDEIQKKVSSMTALELHDCVVRSGTPEEKRKRILNVLESKSVIDADRTVMRKAGSISGELILQGERIDREDCVIAATALLNDEAVVTRNTGHFERIEDLKLRSY